uniref:Ig-like domain-containing protein n=1 Tax=Lepisosteus oculatus TaxID=7918 RepID=W5M2C3_LEPOC
QAQKPQPGNMKTLIQLVFILALWIQESSAQISIDQSPASVSVHTGDTITVQCRASKYIADDMRFYFFKPRQAPKLIMYELYTASFAGTRYSGKWQKDSKDFTFFISNVEVQDAGMYYCGQYKRSPTVIQSRTKTLHE